MERINSCFVYSSTTLFDFIAFNDNDIMNNRSAIFWKEVACKTCKIFQCTIAALF
jgi:hypothetical protein